MKATELRIGNLVTIDGNVVEIYEISNGVIEIANGVEPYSINDIEPIPLTEEWMKRFGFEIKKGAWGTSAEIRIGRVRYVLYQNGNVWSINPTDGFKVDFKYIHTVQNHYFALTGEELTIKQ